MPMKRWMSVMAGVACLMATTIVPGLADEGHGGMKHGQAQGGHEQGEQGEQGEHGGHYLKHLLKHAKEIGLTSEQVGKLKQMQLDCKRRHIKMDADIKIAKLELHALLEDEQAELSAIQAKVDQLKKAEGELLVEAVKTKREAMALLTPEQKEKDRAHHTEMKDEGEGQHGGGMGGKGRGGKGGGGHGGGSGGQQGGEQQHRH